MTKGTKERRDNEGGPTKERRDNEGTTKERRNEGNANANAATLQRSNASTPERFNANAKGLDRVSE